jgi:hypothetical protein
LLFSSALRSISDQRSLNHVADLAAPSRRALAAGTL